VSNTLPLRWGPGAEEACIEGTAGEGDWRVLGRARVWRTERYSRQQVQQSDPSLVEEFTATGERIRIEWRAKFPLGGRGDGGGQMKQYGHLH
jgi:hypothetical protein